MKIVVSVNPGEEILAQWQAAHPEVKFALATEPAAQVDEVEGADAYIGRIEREAFLGAGPRLRWVHSNGAGIETMAAIPELVASDVTVTNTRGGHAPAIAEHMFGLLLALTRRLPDHLEDQREHRWPARGRLATMRELTGATMVVVGMGNIGRAIAKRAVAFEMRVLGVDIKPGPAPDGVEAIWPLDRLDEALRQAEVLVIATPQTAETRGMIDARRIRLLPQDAYLVVVSRGRIVDEPALIAALQSGKLAGAGLDVTATEPLPADNPLWDAPNLLITPHCSAASRQTSERVWDITTENIRRFVAGEPLTNVCDIRAGF
ncbi:MAG: D-2-hydroxyacid dehydrogenase [Thermomicrobiales bacterium]